MSFATLRLAVLSVAAAATFGYAVESAAAPLVKEEGVYTMGFAYGDAEGLVVIAHIADTSGNPATDGVVVFQYCAVRGVPAPSSACLDGSGRWRSIYNGVGVTPQGEASRVYGPVDPSISVIGFRFKYTKGSEIASGVSDPTDWIR